jgi:hypothetical protein
MRTKARQFVRERDRNLTAFMPEHERVPHELHLLELELRDCIDAPLASFGEPCNRRPGRLRWETIRTAHGL